MKEQGKKKSKLYKLNVDGRETEIESEGSAPLNVRAMIPKLPGYDLSINNRMQELERRNAERMAERDAKEAKRDAEMQKQTSIAKQSAKDARRANFIALASLLLSILVWSESKCTSSRVEPPSKTSTNGAAPSVQPQGQHLLSDSVQSDSSAR